MSASGRSRIAVLVPAGNTVHAREFERLRPDNVEFLYIGFDYPPQDADFCRELVRRMRAALEPARAWRPDLVLIGCTTASMSCAGAGLARGVREYIRVPVITAADAGRDAIAALELDVLSAATPYGDFNNAIIETFLRHIGVSVAALEGLDLDRSPDAWTAGQLSLTPARVFDLCRLADRPEAQGLYLPCTGMPSLEPIARFEALTGKSAFSSVQAGFWASLRRLGLRAPQPGVGRLIRQWDF